MGGKAKGEYAWSIKFDDVHIQLCNSQKSLFFLNVYRDQAKPQASSLLKVLDPPLISCGLLLGSPKNSQWTVSTKVRHDYSNSLMVSSCNLNWFDTTV